MSKFFRQLFCRIFCFHDRWKKVKDDEFGNVFGRNSWECKRCGKRLTLSPGDKPLGLEDD